ncbi:MAG: CHASE domain-containing protein, partial [Rhodospirillales bacterium]|nr:CHASE domain-containing protein [Rhodospirillales bacterium]
MALPPGGKETPRFDSARIQALVVALLVLLTGLGLATSAMRWVEADIAEESAERLDRLANRVRNAIEQKFRTPVYGLRGLRATYAMGEEMTRDRFAAWIAARDFEGEFPGVRAFGYAEHVYRWHAIRFVERTRRDGAPDFAIRSDGDAPDMYVVKYIEPAAVYSPLLGVDVGVEAVRRAAIDTAIETGETALSGQVALRGPDGQATPGFLFVLAVYEGGGVPASVAERRAAVRGVLFAALVSEEMVNTAAAAADELIEFDMYDGLPDDSTKPFYSFRTPGVRPAASAGSAIFLPIVIANRLIVVRGWGGPKWAAGIDRTTPVAVGAGVAAFAAGLSFVIWLLATGRARALDLARSMTADLDRLAKVAERTTNGVIIAGEDRRIVWVNEGFTRLTGYTLDEARGRKPRELVQFEGTSTDRDEEI